MVYLTINIYMPYVGRKMYLTKLYFQKYLSRLYFNFETDIIDIIILLPILITYIIDVMIIIK